MIKLTDKIGITDSNGLRGSYEYLHWDKGNETVTLDGDFTLDDLKLIVKHIDGIENEQPNKKSN